MATGGKASLSNGAASLVRFRTRLSVTSAGLGVGIVMVLRLRWAYCAAITGLVAFGCGSPSANLQISAPSGAIKGSPFTVTVTVMVDGRRDTLFNSPIHFTSSDSAAVLPADYAFTAADAGSHSFDVTLQTTGTQSINATDMIAASITATANIAVSPATSDRQFRLSTPSIWAAGSALDTTVSKEDAKRKMR